ncbi:sulfatase-like hydrolase/transferase [Aliiroseovarius crassostreae]|uniref:sulfatase-like hydrolase/transferase n=1 Tax=Aliiroseovarius crassostreae TaxID=154981 RepID=UPI003C7BF8E1
MRRVLIPLGRGFVIALGVVAAVLGMHVESQHLVLGGVVGTLIYLLVLWQQAPGDRRVSRGVMFLYWASAALLLPWAVLRQHFGPFSLSALVFHLEAGLGDKIPDGTILPLAAATALMLAMAHALYMVGSRRRWGAAVLVPLAIVFALANPVTQAAGIKAYFAAVGAPPAVMRDVHPPAPRIKGDHPNLVLIYLEGLERTYGEAPFGAAYAPLADLAQDAVRFTGVGQLPLTDWTTAGIVASQCGYPMVPRGLTQHNRVDTDGGIYAGQTCLGDVLHTAGYRNVAVMGVEAEFGGVAAFLNAHHTDTLIDLHNLKAMGATDESGWGMQDGEVFKAALDELRALERADQPYALTVVTIGPHGPNGYVSKECRRDGIGPEDPDILLAVECTARLTRDFVRRAQGVVDPDNTLFVLVSDHLAHPRVSAITDLIAFDRRNTALMLGAGLSSQDISRPGSMIDLYPTILEAMGFAPQGQRAGLGVSLFSDLPEFGRGQSDWMIQQRLRNGRAFASWLWEGEGTALPPQNRGQAPIPKATVMQEMVRE